MFLAWCISASFGAVTVEKLELAYGDEAAKKSYFSQPIRFWGTHDYKIEQDSYETLLVLSNAKIQYAFRLQGKIVDGKLRNVAICMLRPSIYNWYAGGFVEVLAGDQALTSGEFQLLELKAGTDYGEVTLEYRSSTLSGSFRFGLSDDDDKLQLIFTPSLAENLQSYQLVLTAYPGTYGEKDKRERRLVTNASDVEMKRRDLTGEDYWVVFYDSWYDRKNNLGDGCCAFLYNPKVIISGSLQAGYGCIAKLNYPSTQIAALLLWDFKGWASEDAIQYLKPLSVQFE